MGMKRFDLIKQFSEAMHNSNQYSAVLKKTRLLSVTENQVLGEFTVAQEHLNVGGGLHGGFIATVIDNYTTYTVLKDAAKFPGVSVDIHISYLKGARIGDEILIDAKATKVGKTLAYLECVLKHKKDNSIVAKGTQTMFVGFN